jgi:ABC-type histidine transport system ATPase subunit
LLGGRVEFDESSSRWIFKQGNMKFSIGSTAEGVKKIGILDALLGNRYLTPNSIVFIDEPEAALHPSAVSKLLDIIAILAESGMQFFLASHSYFVVKKLFLIAQQKGMSIPVLSFNAGHWEQADLKDGMFPNPIIDESIRLYEEEVEGALQ